MVVVRAGGGLGWERVGVRVALRAFGIFFPFGREGGGGPFGCGGVVRLGRGIALPNDMWGRGIRGAHMEAGFGSSAPCRRFRIGRPRGAFGGGGGEVWDRSTACRGRN